jgi:hypothetical protein
MRVDIKALLFVSVLLVLAGAGIAAIAMGRTPIGAAMFLLAVTPLPFAVRALKAGKSDNAG